MASCGHRGPDGSHESEPLVCLLLSHLMAAEYHVGHQPLAVVGPLKFAADRGCLFPVSNMRIATANDSSGQFLATNGVENIFLQTHGPVPDADPRKRRNIPVVGALFVEMATGRTTARRCFT